MTSSQPDTLSFAVCTEPPPVTTVGPFAVSSLIEVLPVVRMEHSPPVVTSHSAASSVSAISSPVSARSEKPPAAAARLLSVSEAEVCTSVLPILVSPVAVTCEVSPSGLETTMLSAETPSSVTLPPLMMISPSTDTLDRVTSPVSTPSVMYRLPSTVASDRVQGAEMVTFWRSSLRSPAV